MENSSESSSSSHKLDLVVARELTAFEKEVLHRKSYFGLTLEFNDCATVFEIPKCCAWNKNEVQSCYNAAMDQKVWHCFAKNKTEETERKFVSSYRVIQVDKTKSIHDANQLLEIVPVSNGELQALLQELASSRGIVWEDLTFGQVQQFNPTFHFVNGEYPETEEELDRYILSMIEKTFFYIQDLGVDSYQKLADASNPLDPISLKTPFDFIKKCHSKKMFGIAEIQSFHGGHSTVSGFHVEYMHLDSSLFLPEAVGLNGRKLWIVCQGQGKEALKKALKAAVPEDLRPNLCNLFLRGSAYITPCSFLRNNDVSFVVYETKGNNVMYLPGQYAHLVINTGSTVGLGKAVIGGMYVSGQFEKYQCSHMKARREPKQCIWDSIPSETFLKDQYKKDWMFSGLNLYLKEHSFHKPTDEENPILDQSTQVQVRLGCDVCAVPTKVLETGVASLQDKSSTEAIPEPETILVSERADRSIRMPCYLCSKTFAHSQSLHRHRQKCAGLVSSETFKCSSCVSTFSRRDHLKRHERQQHGLHGGAKPDRTAEHAKRNSKGRNNSTPSAVDGMLNSARSFAD